MDGLDAKGRIERRLARMSMRLPTRARRLAMGPAVRNARGDELDPGLQWMLWLQTRVVPVRGDDLASRRREIERSGALVEGPPRPGLRIEDITLAARPARRYTPQAESSAVFLYIHGGGWSIGSLRSHDRLCQRFAHEARVTVVSLDYRLAPEHPFPAGLDDVVAAFGELRPGAERLWVGGDSAGGNLTAALCLTMIDAGERLPDGVVLLYPGTEMHSGSGSRREFAEGFYLTLADVQFYRGHYGAQPNDPRASPLLAGDLSKFPPTILTTAGFDPLRDEGEAFAGRLADAGVAVTHLNHRSMIHGYANMDGLVPGADAAVAEISAALRVMARN